MIIGYGMKSAEKSGALIKMAHARRVLRCWRGEELTATVNSVSSNRQFFNVAIDD
ncbi:MAG: Unknown protein [uncultured Thiotrichaceae bacterium]|uniref:Uncharacterized protein n=1 Tax=uncultured Thiotrichaceae bacterium TaxID=298394 RepID=A0A6S6SCP3_9GAMM|nr:MAG: Unknown protein [uncultured Thiotrichaceae bacterium]